MDNKAFPVVQQDMKIKRATMTRWCTKINEFVGVVVESVESLSKAQRLADSAAAHWQDLSLAFEHFAERIAAECEERLEAEYEKHSTYQITYENAAEALMQTIDHLRATVGDFPTRSSTAMFSGETEQQTENEENNEIPTQGQAENAETATDYLDQATQQFQDLRISPSAKHPEKKIIKFNGDPAKYKKWWSIFTIYVDSQPLDPTEKFRLLEGTLVGKAARAVAHLDFMAESYEIAKDILSRRFGSIERASAAHVHSIQSLCNAKDLDRNDKFIDFVSLIGQHIRSLISLGGTFESLSLLATPTILDCLPLEHRKKFCENSKLDESGRCPLEALLAYLEDQALLLEECSRPRNEHTGKNSRFPGKGKNQGFEKNPQGYRSESQAGKSNSAFVAGTSSPDHSCIFCRKEHQSFKCTKRLSPEERKKLVESESGCIRCLRRNHQAKKCRAKVARCSKCGGNHSAMICSKSAADAESPEAAPTTSMVAANSNAKAASGAFLQTGYAWAKRNNSQRICRILLDPGSQRSFVTKRVADALKLTPTRTENVTVFGIAGQSATNERVNVFDFDLQSRFSAKQIKISCLEVPSIIGGSIPRIELQCDLHPLADGKADGFPEDLDLLVGCDYLHMVYNGMYKKLGNMTASPTIFGWVLWGSAGANQISSAVITSTSLCQSFASKPAAPPSKPESKLESLEFLWRAEVLGIEPSHPNEDEAEAKEMQDFFRKTVQRSPEGRYTVTLPFKNNVATLGDNQKLAFSRLMAFLKNARKNPQLLRAVDNEIKKFLDLGYAEAAEPRKPQEQVHYLPLLAVAKKSLAGSSVQRVRVVKDGGSRTPDEAALNDVLEQGPSLLPSVIEVLLHFRCRPVAIVCDIEQAFMNFLINKDQRTFLRFYWPLGIADDPQAKVREFWATVLDFGLVCSPWLHCAGIRHHLDETMKSHPQHSSLLEEVRRTFYMDDIASGAHTLKEAKQKVSTLVKVFKSGHFPLNKWSTNSNELAKFIAKNSPQNCSVSSTETHAKFLGVSWNQQPDYLFIDVEKIGQNLQTGVPTKRKLLSGLSQIYDPLNFLCPTTIRFKMLFQKLWLKKIEWDVPLTGILEEEFKACVDDLISTGDLQIPRCLFSRKDDEAIRELHVFADASLLAYGCVAYIREIPFGIKQNQATIKLVLAKARVAPLQGKWTIPRLELLAAVVATRISQVIKDALPGRISATFMYSDNSSVLGWIRDKPERWKVFVANRIKEIQAGSDVNSWSYVRSEENPADLLSRGTPIVSPELRKLWLQGPSWLAERRRPEGHALNPEKSTVTLAEKRENAIAAVAGSKQKVEAILQREVSSWPKVVRIIAYVRRFIKRTRKALRQESLTIETSEFKEAETALIKNLQGQHFPGELHSNAENIERSSVLRQLSPFVDTEGLLRCRTRLEKSNDISFDEKFPVILPNNNFLVGLFVRWIHGVKCLHSGGIASTLQQIRKRFFILSARRTAKKAISGCKTCARFSAKQASEPVPPLPAFRVEESQPFAFCGVDHAGPIYIKNELGERQKAYILLFCCAVTRAVRLELVADLSTEEFMLALRRFVSRNPGVNKIVSDNAKTFQRAEKDIAAIFKHAKSPPAASFLAVNGIEWQYSTAKAPWQGGFWERMVQVVKRPLRKVMGTRILSFRELETVLTEIEAVVNNRPIASFSTDPGDIRALSPADLLYGYSGRIRLPDTVSIPKITADSSAIVFSERFKKQQAALRGFWKRFQNEYLQNLRSAHFRKPQESRTLKPGDICILHSADASRAYWPLCRVQAVFGGEGTDRRHRSCEIKMSTGQILKRPIQLLYPLEVSDF